MTEREVLFGVLGRLARRLWLARIIREAAFIVCVILFCAVCYRLVLPSLTEGPAAVRLLVQIAFVAAVAALCIEMIGRNARGVSTMEAAVEADARARLDDELKSAHWFIEAGDRTAIEALQIGRAAATASRLDLALLVPHKLPGTAWSAAALVLCLVAVMSLVPQLVPAHESTPAGPAVDTGSDLHALLKDGPDTPETQKLDRALRELQQAESTAGDKVRAFAEARDAIDQANMEASAAREEMVRLSASLAADPTMEAVARALAAGRLEQAKAMLHDLHGSSRTEAAMTDESLEKKPDTTGAEGAARDAAGRDPGKTAMLNQEALNRVERAIERAQQSAEVQNRVNGIKRRMDDNLVATSQRSRLTASRFDNRSTAANPTAAPESGNVNVRGGALFREAAVAREAEDESRDGSQTGDATGESVSQPLEGRPTARLGAKLKLEAILQKAESGDDPDGKGDAGAFYAASREQKSVLRNEDVASNNSGYRRDAALDHDRVPERQRPTVKRYFLNLHESESK